MIYLNLASVGDIRLDGLCLVLKHPRLKRAKSVIFDPPKPKTKNLISLHAR